MERLTFDGNFCDISKCGYRVCPYDGNCSQKQVWERLREYEDTRLSPHACKQAREIEEGLSGEDYSISRMVELMNADKIGRIVVLPCNVGDTVWRIVRDGEPHITRDAVRDMYFADEMTLCIELVGGRVTFTEKFGKTVFLTREEAEEALQEMEGKKDG